MRRGSLPRWGSGCLEKRHHRHEDAGGTEAALQAVGLAEGGLQRMQRLAIRRQAFDGCEHVAVGLDGKEQAGPHRLAIE